MRELDFSKWELRKWAMKTAKMNAYKSADCVGSIEEEFETKRVEKKCRGVVTKVKIKPIAGTLNLTMHIPYDIYCDMFDMVRDDLVEGVQGYGVDNIHQDFSCVGELYNEDNEMMLVAYPKCVSATGPNTNVENGAEEIPEVELEISLMPDENGYLRYEALPDELTGDPTIATQWMTNFTPELVAKSPSA